MLENKVSKRMFSLACLFAYAIIFSLIIFQPITSVSSATCGDGKIEETETCDDGNTTSGDGCSATCQTETTSDEPNITAFSNFLGKIASYLKAAIILAAAFTAALGAFMYTTSGGDPKKIGKAKEYFYSTITALVALVIAYLFFK